MALRPRARQRSKSNTWARAACASPCKAPMAMSENLYAADIPESILTSFFAIEDKPALPVSVATGLRVPSAEGELPEHLQLQLAAFAQQRLRAHVLTSAAGPQTAMRPLTFENMRLTWKKTGTGGAKRPGMCIRAYLHQSSVTCFCGAHLLPPPERRYGNVRFTGKSYACMTIEMYGECVSNDMGCPTHSAKCRATAVANGVCCNNVSVSFACTHEAQQAPGSEEAVRVVASVGPLDTYDWQELTMLLGLAANYVRARPLYAGVPQRSAPSCRASSAYDL